MIKKEENPKLEKLQKIIYRNSKYMKNLVEKTLELEKLSLSDIDKDLTDTDLHLAVEKMIKNKEFVLEDEDITADNKVNENIMVKADKTGLERLLDNLITNSIKFTPEGGNIIVDATENEDFVTVSVSDNGIGISEEEMEHIFDEFYKADLSRHDLDSSGLGLSICKRIVEQHGGKIWVESPGKGKGSTFYFTLPKSKK